MLCRDTQDTLPGINSYCGALQADISATTLSMEAFDKIMRDVDGFLYTADTAIQNAATALTKLRAARAAMAEMIKQKLATPPASQQTASQPSAGSAAATSSQPVRDDGSQPLDNDEPLTRLLPAGDDDDAAEHDEPPADSPVFSGQNDPRHSDRLPSPSRMTGDDRAGREREDGVVCGEGEDVEMQEYRRPASPRPKKRQRVNYYQEGGPRLLPGRAATPAPQPRRQKRRPRLAIPPGRRGRIVEKPRIPDVDELEYLLPDGQVVEQDVASNILGQDVGSDILEQWWQNRVYAGKSHTKNTETWLKAHRPDHCLFCHQSHTTCKREDDGQTTTKACTQCIRNGRPCISSTPGVVAPLLVLPEADEDKTPFAYFAKDDGV